MQREIILPETKPALEWILGQAVQKVSPQRRHALLQGELLRRLAGWARGRGEVGTEWRFRISPPGAEIRPLVPDVAYLSYERMGEASDDELEAPLVPPNAAFEVRSPDDRQVHIDHKLEVYLAAGTDAVFIVDPAERTIVACDRSGRHIFRHEETLTHEALPGFELCLTDLFDVLRRPR
jgi:Uma2 family endonuclease